VLLALISSTEFKVNGLQFVLFIVDKILIMESRSPEIVARETVEFVELIVFR
jgi:hypothetical protein